MNPDESLREIQKQFASTVINGTAPEKAYIDSIAKIKALFNTKRNCDHDYHCANGCISFKNGDPSFRGD